MNNLFKKIYIGLLCSFFFASVLVGMDGSFVQERLSKDQVLLEETLDEYQRKLPQIGMIEEATIAEQIVSFLCKFDFEPQKAKSGHKELAAQIQSFIDRNVTIEFSIAAFPLKSMNIEKKVIALLGGNSEFDAADYVGLLTLNHVCAQIQSIYSLGAKITILSWEPYLFASNAIIQRILGVDLVSMQRYEAYQKDLRRLCGENGCFSFLATGGYQDQANILQDLINSPVLQALMDSRDSESVYKKYYNDFELQAIITEASYIFGELDCDFFRSAVQMKYSGIKDSGIEKCLKVVAKQIACCFKEGRKLMAPVRQQSYGNSIYLSVRQPADGDVSKKLPIGFVYNSFSACSLRTGTPWHNAFFIDQATKNIFLTSCSEIERCNRLFRVTYATIGEISLLFAVV